MNSNGWASNGRDFAKLFGVFVVGCIFGCSIWIICSTLIRDMRPFCKVVPANVRTPAAFKSSADCKFIVFSIFN